MTALAHELVEWMRTHPVLALASLVLGWLAAIAVLGWVLGKILRRGNVWRDLQRAGRWLNAHLVQLLSWLALPVLAVALVRSYLDASSKPYHQLVLFGLLAAAAVLAQFGNDLLARLKRVGPVEFVEQRFERITPELKGLPSPLNLSSPERQPLSNRLLHEYEKADRYVTYLEWSGLHGETAQSEKFHDLLFKMSAVALHQGDWVRVADRLELLLRISRGKFKSAETHYRCGVAYSYWAESSRGTDREDCFQQAQDHLWKAVSEDPHHWRAYSRLAYVQVDLKMYELARQNNQKAIEIRPDYAAAKYNLAICSLKLGDLDAALNGLKSIAPGDRNAERVISLASTDEELKPLLRDEQRGPEARRFLRSFKARSS